MLAKKAWGFRDVASASTQLLNVFVRSCVEREHRWAEYCSVGEGGGSGACTDSFEPNNGSAGAPELTVGTHDLQICDGDTDWFTVPGGGTVSISFSHWAGDLDLKAYDAGGQQTDISQSTSDGESVTVPAGGSVEVYGYQGATGAYGITL